MLKEDYIECLSKLQNQFDSLVSSSQVAIDLEKVIDSLNYNFGSHIDSYIPEYFDGQLKQVDETTKALVQKIVILQCALNNWDAIFLGSYGESTVTQYQKTFNRFLSMCDTAEGWSKELDDYYYKDLAMATRMMFPSGAQVTEASCGFGVKQGLNGGLIDSARFLWLTLMQGGCKDYYQIHTHTPELSEFNPQGWNDCYLRIAEMLELNPQVKGIFGGSWFYDPQLKDISPRLMYLQDVPLENGASSFYTHLDTTGNAIYSSKTRRKLFDEGKYTPKSYLLIWPREAMIKWARAYKSSNNIEEIPAGVVK
jgi:hypothetical protein